MYNSLNSAKKKNYKKTTYFTYESQKIINILRFRSSPYFKCIFENKYNNILTRDTSNGKVSSFATIRVSLTHLPVCIGWQVVFQVH